MRAVLAALVVLALAACGDDTGVPLPGDAGTDTTDAGVDFGFDVPTDVRDPLPECDPPEFWTEELRPGVRILYCVDPTWADYVSTIPGIEGSSADCIWNCSSGCDRAWRVTVGGASTARCPVPVYDGVEHPDWVGVERPPETPPQDSQE